MYHSINITFKLQSFEAIAYIVPKCHLNVTIINTENGAEEVFLSLWFSFLQRFSVVILSHLSGPALFNTPVLHFQEAIKSPTRKYGKKRNSIADYTGIHMVSSACQGSGVGSGSLSHSDEQENPEPAFVELAVLLGRKILNK